MNRRRRWFVTPLILLMFTILVAIAFLSYRDNNKAVESSSAQIIDKAYITDIVKQAIHDNPELIIQSLENYQQQIAKNSFEKAKDNIKSNRNEYENNINDPKIGDNNAPIKVVYWLDYSCGYCKKMAPINERIIEENGDVQLIFKQLPILGGQSIIKAKAALAVNRIDKKKYYQFHKLLIEFQSEVNIEAMVKLADIVNIDENYMRQVINSDAIEAALEHNINLGQTLGISATPTYVINGDFIPGAIRYEQFDAKLRALRKSNQ